MNLSFGVDEEFKARRIDAGLAQAIDKGVDVAFGLRRQMALNGFFDSVPVSDVRKKDNELLNFIEKLHSNSILKPLRETNELNEFTESALEKALEDFSNLNRHV